MPDEPSWEWVDGDPVRAAQYALLGGVFLSIAAVFAAFTIVGILSFWGVTSYSSLPSLDVCLIVLPLLGAEYFFLLYVPRRFPVVARIGVSAIGLRLVTVFPIHVPVLNWTRVRAVGRDWIDVDMGIFTSRYRLTLTQAQRVRQFLQVGEAAQRYPYPTVARPS
jgi:hypothetical protein